MPHLCCFSRCQYEEEVTVGHVWRVFFVSVSLFAWMTSDQGMRGEEGETCAGMMRCLRSSYCVRSDIAPEEGLLLSVTSS